MNHQPIKKLLLDESQRTLKEEQDLWVHLKDCKECQNIDTNWQAVKQQVKISNMVSPTPGFTDRWKMNLALHRAQQRQQRQTLMLALILVAAFVTIASIISIWYIFTSPAGIFVAFTRMVAALVQILTFTPQDFLAWFSSLPLAIPIIAGVGLLVWATAFSLTGAAALWRISKKGVVIQ